MAATQTKLFAAVLALATIVGCGVSPQARFYTLRSTGQAGVGAAAAYSVGVGPVSVPAAVDRPQFVVQVAPNRVDIDEFSRWAAPLNEAIARAVAGNLAMLLGTADVGVMPLASFSPTYRVIVEVQRFQSVPGDAALLDAAWAVRRAADKEKRSGRTLARESVADESMEALAAAHSDALLRLSSDIAAAIREMDDRAR